MAESIASLLAWLLIGCIVVGIVGLLVPILIFVLGFGLAVLAFAVLAWIVGRILS